MNKRDLIIFLVLQLIAIVWAGLVFKLFESRLLAGALAGTYFVASGLYMVRRLWRWSDKWRACATYPLLVHVFLIAIPMLVIRMSHTQTDFSEIRILGLPGPVFHQLSTSVFSVLLLATLTDLVRVYRRPHRKLDRVV